MRKSSYKVYDPIKFHMIFPFFMVDSRDTVVFNFTLKIKDIRHHMGAIC